MTVPSRLGSSSSITAFFPKMPESSLRKAIEPIIWVGIYFFSFSYFFVKNILSNKHFFVLIIAERIIFKSNGLFSTLVVIGILFHRIVPIAQKKADELFAKWIPLDLARYASPRICLEHLRSERQGIDLSDVSDSIQIENLLEEGDLRDSLSILVQRIRTRQSFTGTPPAGTIELEQFYQQMEAGIRFVLHRIEQQREDPDYHRIKKRFFSDLASSVSHCASRAMAEVMGAYAQFQGEMRIGSLESLLIECLAEERLRLIQGLAIYFARDPEHSANEFVAALQSFGGLLGLPGVSHVIETVSPMRSREREQILRAFFQAYTSEFIRNTIQAKIRSSQILRELIFDWLKDLVGAWRKQEFGGLAEELLKYDARQIDQLLQVKGIAPLPQPSRSNLRQHLECHRRNLFLAECIEIKDEQFSLKKSSLEALLVSFKILKFLK